jgi:DNA-binding transcriptional LysR family regulator
MENHLLKYQAFVKAVEKGSFTKAAEDLNYAQSSISKMIADLEADWGVVLLERNKKGVCLTSSGKQILPFARRIINDCSELDGYIKQMNGVETGIVRIGTFASVAINLLPDIFIEFQKAYPGIEYELLLGDYTEVECWIEDGRVDCGFLCMPTSASLDTILVKKDEYKVVLPAEHPLADKKVVSIKDLNGQPFMLLEHGEKTEISSILEENNVHPNIRFTTWEDFAIMAMVEKGLGIAILPGMILERIPYKIEIRSLKRPYYRSIGLAMKDRNRLTPAVRKFVECVICKI